MVTKIKNNLTFSLKWSANHRDLVSLYLRKIIKLYRAEGGNIDRNYRIILECSMINIALSNILISLYIKCKYCFV